METSLAIAGTKFVRLCPGISVIIGDLKIDPDYVDEDCSIPIDTLVVNMSIGAAEVEL